MQNLEHGTIRNGVASRLNAFIRDANESSVTHSVGADSKRPTTRRSRVAWPETDCEEAEVEYRLACSRSDFLGAFELLQKRYQDAGLAAPSTSGVEACRIRMMPCHSWEQSQVMVAAVGERIIGTVTLISEGRFELPILEYYQNEVNANREVGTVSEITSLAVDPSHTKPTEVFARLTRLLMFFARHHGVESLAAIVHPRHAKFYQHAMGYQIIGSEVQCRQVCGEPGVAVLGSVNDRSRYRKRWEEHYFDGAFRYEDVQARPITSQEYSYCHSLVQQANLHAELCVGAIA